MASLSYKPGWSFRRGGPLRSMLCIFATTPDSNDPRRSRCTQHQFPFPDLEGRELVRWVHERVLDCERHEVGEFFTVGGHRPFMPHHQDEGSPYEHVERWPDEGSPHGPI